MPDAQCPGCDLRLPEADLAGQVAHMNEAHPEIVAERLEAAGFEHDGTSWVDMLAEDEDQRDAKPEEFEQFIEKHGEHMMPPES